MVRTPGFHPGNRGSIPLGRTKIKTEYKILNGDYLWSHSSVGRAPALQAGGHRFKSYCDHHLYYSGGVAQLVRAPACHAGGREFEPRHSRHLYAALAHLVEQLTCNQ